MEMLNFKNSLNTKYLKIISRSSFFIFILLLLTLNSIGQVFNAVQCKLKYEGMFNMNVIDNKLFNSSIYEMCGDTLNSIGVWNDTIWNDLDSGVIAGNVYCFTKYKGYIYVGGNITIVGSKRINVRGIAKIVNNKWDTVSYGIGFNNNQNKITSLTVYKDELYAAGYFTEIDGKPAQSIAKWDGIKWTVIPGVQSSFTQVNCMVVYKDELYVGGHFWTAGGKPANFIARWNGITWNTLGTGLNSQVTSMVVDSVRNLLYVGGYFGGVNDTLRGRVMMWDGQKWHQLGDNKNYLSFQPVAVTSLEYYNGYIYAGGLSHKGLVTDTVLTRWNGKRWEPLLGLNNGITNLKYYKGKLYIGGVFTKINNDSIPYLASFYSTDSVAVGLKNENLQYNNTIKIFPNPSNDILHIESPISLHSYKIFDLMGHILKEEKINNAEISPSNYTIYIDKLVKGTYIIQMFDDQQKIVETKKFILEDNY